MSTTCDTQSMLNLLPSRCLGVRYPFSLYMHYSPDIRVNFGIAIPLCLLTDVILLRERTQRFEHYEFFIFHKMFRPKHVVEDKRVQCSKCCVRSDNKNNHSYWVHIWCC